MYEKQKETAKERIEDLMAVINANSLERSKEVVWLEDVVKSICKYDEAIMGRDTLDNCNKDIVERFICNTCRKYSEAASLVYPWKGMLAIESAEGFVEREKNICGKSIEFIGMIRNGAKKTRNRYPLWLFYPDVFPHELKYLEGFLGEKKRYLEAVADFSEGVDSLPDECHEMLENICGIEYLLGILARLLEVARIA